MGWLVLWNVVLLLLALVAAQVVLARRARRAVGRGVPDLPDPTLRDAASSGAPVLWWFHSPSCGPCRAMRPVIDALEQEHPGRVHRIDVRRDLETARALGVMATPTTLRVREGTVEEVWVGPQPERVLRAALDAT